MQFPSASEIIKKIVKLSFWKLWEFEWIYQSFDAKNPFQTFNIFNPHWYKMQMYRINK